MKKSRIIIAFFMLLLTFVTTIQHVDAISVQKTTDSTILDANYGWCMKYIPGVTQVTTYGMTNHSIDFTKQPPVSDGVDLDQNKVVTARLTSNSQKGNIWIRYNNVGTYYGQIVDLKITLVDWDYLQPAGNNNYPTIFFCTDRLTTQITGRPAVSNPKYRYTFYKHGTDEEYPLKGHVTFQDMDGNSTGGQNEYIIPVSGLVSAYLTTDTKLQHQSGDKIVNSTNGLTGNNDKFAWTTLFFEGSSFEFIYSRLRDIKGNSYSNVSGAATSRNLYQYLTSFHSIRPFDIPTPVKSADVSKVEDNQVFHYTVTHYVPGEDPDFWYSRYTMTDKIPSCFSIENVEIHDDTGADVKSWFNVSISDNTITATANSSTLSNDNFYNTDYTFRFTVRKKAGYDMLQWFDGNTCNIPNTATVDVVSSSHSGTRQSNTVTVTSDCYFKVLNTIDHGTITENDYVVLAGTNKTVTWKPQRGYYVKSVKIDGVEQSSPNILGDSYTFNNVKEDHTVDVLTEPMKVKINISKLDADNRNKTKRGDAQFVGAQYTIYRDAACQVAVDTVTLDANGNGTSKELDIVEYVGGNYNYYETFYIKETKAPVGYNIDIEVHTVTQLAQNQTTRVTEHNVTSYEKVIENDIEIIKYLEKTDSTPKQNLAGAVFTASLNSDPSQTWTSTPTDSKGYCIIEDLPYGTYTIRETKVPDTAYNGEFYVNGANTRSTTFEQFVEIDNTQRGPYRWEDINDVAKKMQIVITKEDIETGSKTQGDAHLECAKYGLYRDKACTDLVEEITIEKQADGTYKATSGWYLVGTYYVKETKAPEGYLIDETVYTVKQVPAEQTAEHSTHQVLSKDQVMKGIVRVRKYNKLSESSTDIPAAGAKLRLTLVSNPDVYYDAVVDDTGYLEFVDPEDEEKYYPYTIPYGVYEISEVQASNSGKHIFINKQSTEIRYDEQEQYYIMSDEYVRLRLTIKKKDIETGKQVPGSGKYKIWNVTKQEWYQERKDGVGDFTDVLTTNSKGQIVLNGILESGTYVIYEIQAPEGYYLDDELREGQVGYEFAIGVGKDGNVVAVHNLQEEVLKYNVEDYDNIPTKIYSYEASIENTPQKAQIKVEKLAEQLTKTEKKDSEYGSVNTPVFEKVGLEGVTFRLVAAEDVVTPEGTVRYTKGQVVSTFTTGKDGIGTSDKVYLGKYTLEEISTPNGYVNENEPESIELVYTNDKEEVQIINRTIENRKQKVELEFEKIFEELKVSKFKYDERKAVFGIYTQESLKNYKGESVLGEDELVDVLVTDENNMLRNTVELPEGKYYVKEIYVSNPYIKSQDKYEFTVEYTNSRDEKIELTVNEGQIENINDVGELELHVYPDVVWKEKDIPNITDRDELTELSKEYGVAGKTYRVYHDEECKNPVMTTEDEYADFITDENGMINIPDIPTGVYYLKETVAPYGYELSEEVIKAEIVSGKVTVLKAQEPLKKAKLLEKVDTFTKDVIKGVEFEIQDEDENVIYSSKTDKEGVLEIPIIYLTNGQKYYIIERNAPDMYQDDEIVKEFVAKYDEEKCEWELELIEIGNRRKSIESVIVRKTDKDTGELLEGCEFTIVLLDENGNEYVNANGENIYLVENAVTDENGEYVINAVPYGTYKFVEIKAPEGYELDEDITGLVFTVNEKSADTIIFEVTNTGDIAVYALSAVALVSILGIVYVIKRNKKLAK